MTEGPAAAEQPSRTRPHLGLSGKLLVLTLLFVMIAEVLIYVPSVANFRQEIRRYMCVPHTEQIALRLPELAVIGR